MSVIKKVSVIKKEKQLIPIMAPKPPKLSIKKWKEVAADNWLPWQFDISRDDTLNGIVTNEIGLLTKTKLGTEWLQEWWDLEQQRKRPGGHSVTHHHFHCPFTYKDSKNNLTKNLWAEAVVKFETCTFKNSGVGLWDLRGTHFVLLSQEKVKLLAKFKQDPGIKVKFSYPTKLIAQRDYL